MAHQAKPRSLWHNGRLLLIVVAFSLLCTVRGTKKLKKRKKEKKVYPDYLYGEDAGAVKEFMASTDPNQEHPDFMYGENKPGRVVIFYQPWCPHCRKFRDHYIDLAREVNEVARDEGIPPIEFHSVSCQPHHKLCKTFGFNAFPQLKLFAPNATKATDLKFTQIHPLIILRLLGIHGDHLNLGNGSDKENVHSGSDLSLRSLQGWVESVPAANEQVDSKRTKQQIFDDAFLSVDFILRNGIFLSDGPLPEAQKKAFLSMLLLMQKSLPQAWEVQRIVESLLSKFEDVASSEEKMIEVLDQFDSPVDDWSPECRKGQVGMGYTCGLWTFLHIVTVGFVEWNRLLPSGDKERTMGLESEKAGKTLRDFIFHFFSCEECRTHFANSYDKCDHDRCNRLRTTKMMWAWQELPTWFYDMHNAVNVRLLREKAAAENRTITEEDETEKIWPTRHDCRKCFKEDGSRDKTMVYKYLRIEYWPEDHITDEFRSELGFVASSSSKETALPATKPTALKEPASSLAGTPIFLVLSGVPLAVLLVASVALRGRKTKTRRGHQKRLESARNLSLKDPDKSALLSPSKSPRRKVVNSSRLGRHLSPIKSPRVMMEVDSSSQLEGCFDKSELPFLQTQ